MIRNPVCVLCLLVALLGCEPEYSSPQTTPQPDSNPEFDPEPVCNLDGDCNAEGFCNGEGACVDETFVCECDDECGEGRLCDTDSSCFDKPAAYRFVLIKDDSGAPRSDFPGIDLDTISLLKPSGEEIFATDIHLSDISCENNLACDIPSAIGPPDAFDPETDECFEGGAPDPSTFLAFNGGQLIVSFGDEVIENRDSIMVYEIGAALCGRFDDDPWSITILKRPSPDDPDATRLGTLCDGCTIVDVSGLDEVQQESRVCGM